MAHRVRAINAAIALAWTAALTLVSCAGSTPTEPVALHHVHGLGYDSDTGDLFIAAHSGVWKLPGEALSKALAEGSTADTSGLRQTGNRDQDTMGMEMLPDGSLLASGHPDPEEQPDLNPPVLGLIRSTDGAETWETVSLRGEVDFHDIEAVELTDGEFRVYGYDATRGLVMTSSDSGRTWTDGPSLDLRDLAAVPGTDAGLYATTAEGLMVSTDAGASFTAAPGAPALFLLDTSSPALGLIGIDVEGVLWQQSGDGAWVRGGRVEGAPEALLALDSDPAWVIVAETRGLYATKDLGKTWVPIIPA